MYAHTVHGEVFKELDPSVATVSGGTASGAAGYLATKLVEPEIGVAISSAWPRLAFGILAGWCMYPPPCRLALSTSQSLGLKAEWLRGSVLLTGGTILCPWYIVKVTGEGLSHRGDSQSSTARWRYLPTTGSPRSLRSYSARSSSGSSRYQSW
jgi:hypothetical protein